MHSNCGAWEDSWQSLGLQEDQPYGDQRLIFIGIFIGRTDADDEALILWPCNMKGQLIGKYPDVGKDWRQKRRRAAEDEVVREHHWRNRHEFEQTLGDCGEQRRLACCSPWVTMSRTQLSNWTKSNRNITLWCQFSSPHSVLRSLCLVRQSSSIYCTVSGPAVGTVGSSPTQIWPYSSLFTRFTIALKVHSLKLVVGIIHCTWCCENEFPSSSWSHSPSVLHFRFGPTPHCRLPSGVCSLTRQERPKAKAYWDSLAQLD